MLQREIHIEAHVVSGLQYFTRVLLKEICHSHYFFCLTLWDSLHFLRNICTESTAPLNFVVEPLVRTGSGRAAGMTAAEYLRYFLTAKTG